MNTFDLAQLEAGIMSKIEIKEAARKLIEQKRERELSACSLCWGSGRAMKVLKVQRFREIQCPLCKGSGKQNELS